MKKHFLKTIFISLSSIFLYSTSAAAQLIPDNTLGRESSRVIPSTTNPNRDNIRGGAVRGTNLFHSFREFNVNQNREVYFNNPTGIQNILTRVTGRNISNIFGTLGVEGNANLYLINPNGIVFGDGAKLDLNGTFIGTTADGIKLGKSDVYSATDPASSSLLTIKPGTSFIERKNALKKAILNQGNLEINPGANLTLSADEINNNGSIVARGGNVFLEAVNGDINTGDINVNSRENEGNISLIANGNININDNSSIGSVNFPPQGDFFSFEFLNDELNTNIDLASLTGNGGDISLIADGNIILNNGAAIMSLGRLGGSINIESKGNLAINNAGIFSISAGNIRGKGRDIRLKAESIELNGGKLGSLPLLETETGEIFINTNFLRLVNGGQILAFTGSIGNSANITIAAKDLEIIGQNPINNDEYSGLIAISFGSGNAGNISINTDSLLVEKGGQITTVTQASGKSGNITIAAKQIELTGSRSVDNSRSVIAAESFGAANGGNINIKTDLLLLGDRSLVSASASDNNLSQGNGGNVTINSPLIIANPRDNFIEANAETGNGGNININTKAIFGYPQFLTLDASSGFGIDGIVNIEGLTDEITKASLLTLPPALDAVAIMAKDVCAVNKKGEIAGGSSFTIIGKGGITPNPLERVDRTPSGIVEWSDRPEGKTKIKKRAKVTPEKPQPKKISQPAVGWYRRTDGTVVLTANPDEVRPLSMPVDYPSGCGKETR